MKAVREVAAKHPEEIVVLVSHVVVCRVLICAVLGLDNSHFWQVKQDTCAINIFEMRDSEFILTLLNDTCHLKGIS